MEDHHDIFHNIVLIYVAIPSASTARDKTSMNQSSVHAFHLSLSGTVTECINGVSNEKAHFHNYVYSSPKGASAIHSYSLSLQLLLIFTSIILVLVFPHIALAACKLQVRDNT